MYLLILLKSFLSSFCRTLPLAKVFIMHRLIDQHIFSTFPILKFTSLRLCLMHHYFLDYGRLVASDTSHFSSKHVTKFAIMYISLTSCILCCVCCQWRHSLALSSHSITVYTLSILCSYVCIIHMLRSFSIVTETFLIYSSDINLYFILFTF